VSSIANAAAQCADFHFAPDEELSGLGGAPARFNYNIAALRLLK
jgi:hypothetical protein